MHVHFVFRQRINFEKCYESRVRYSSISTRLTFLLIHRYSSFYTLKHINVNLTFLTWINTYTMSM